MMVDLIEKLKKTIDSYEPKEGETDLCERYSQKARQAYLSYFSGDEKIAIEFIRHWANFLFVNKLLTVEDIKPLTNMERLKLGIVYSYKSSTVINNGGKWLVIDSEVEILGFSECYCHGEAEVHSKDPAYITLYDNSVAHVRDAIVYAFNNSTVDVVGSAVVHAYDTARVTGLGNAAITLYNKSNNTASSTFLVKDKRK